MKRLYWLIPLILVLVIPVCSVFATGSAPTSIYGVPTNTSIYLKWDKGSISDNVTLVYRTDRLPTTYSDGTVSYNGSAANYNLTGLIAGTTYYFGLWEYNGGYSATSLSLVMTTLATAQVSGATPTPNNSITFPTLPASATQTPVTSGLNLEPFTTMINWFNSSPGGLGMPTTNAWESIAIFVIFIVSLLVYIKLKNIYLAWGLMVVLTIILTLMGLVQGYLIFVEIIVGAGIWGIERAYQ